MNSTGVALLERRPRRARSARCRAPRRGRDPASCTRAPRRVRRQRRLVAGSARGRGPCAFQCVDAPGARRGDRRGRSSRRSCGSRARAISSRTSSAMKRKKFSTNSGLPVNLLAQLRILRRDADRAGVEVADAHHHAARSRPAARSRSRTPRRRAARAMTTSRPVFIWPSTWTTMRSRSSLSTQHLLRLGQAELPRHAGVLDAGQRRRAGAAVVARDQHDVGVRLGTRRPRPCRRRLRRPASRGSAPRGLAFFRS